MQSTYVRCPKLERRIITAPINHVSSHMYASQALTPNVPVQELMLNHLMLATIDTNTARKGAHHCFTHRYPNDRRINHIFGIQIHSVGTTSDNPVTEDTYRHSTFITFNWKQGQ